MLSNFTVIDEEFVCENCGNKVPKLGYSCRNHCPVCLHSKHVDINPGDRAETCHGLLEPIGLEINNKKLDEAKKSNDEKKIILHEKLAKLLQDQPELFFKTDMESSLKILVQLLPENEVKEAYTSLISPENFENLRRKFKI